MPQHVLAILLVLLHALPSVSVARFDTARSPQTTILATVLANDDTCGCACTRCACPCQVDHAPRLPTSEPEPTTPSTDRPTLVAAGHTARIQAVPGDAGHRFSLTRAQSKPLTDGHSAQASLCRWLT